MKTLIDYGFKQLVPNINENEWYWFYNKGIIPRGNTMVERTKTEGIEEFEGTITDITFEQSELKGDKQEQYHISMTPNDTKLLEDSKTGMLHTWIKFSDKATQESIPEGSVLDRFLTEIETLHTETKKLKTVDETMQFIKGKKYLFKTKRLGKAYDGHEAKAYWVPVKAL